MSLVNPKAETLQDLPPMEVIFNHERGRAPSIKFKFGIFQVHEHLNVYINSKLNYGSFISLQTMKAQMKLLFVHMTEMNYVGLDWPLEPYQ